MKLLYAITGVLVLTVASILLIESRPGFADHDCTGCVGDQCAWAFLPTATQADANGFFDTATDGDDNELAIDWCFSSHTPAGGSFSFVAEESSNIDQDPENEPEYTPTIFQISHCSGSQEVTVSGRLIDEKVDGTLVTRALIGTFPGCGQEVDKSLAINSF